MTHRPSPVALDNSLFHPGEAWPLHHHTDFFFKACRTFESFFLHSPSLSGQVSSTSHCCTPAFKNLDVVREGINGCFPLMHSCGKIGLKNIIMQKSAMCCNEGAHWEQHDCDFCRRAKEKEGNWSVQTDLRCNNLNMHTVACEIFIFISLGNGVVVIVFFAIKAKN